MPSVGNRTKRKTIEYISKQISLIEPTTTLLSTKYENNREPLKFECACGNIFYKNWTTIQSNRTCKCRSCTRKDGWRHNRRAADFSAESYFEFVKCGFVPQEIVSSVKQKVLCKDTNGYLGYISIENARNGKHFSVFSTKFNKNNLLYNLNIYAKNNGYNTRVISYREAPRRIDIMIDCVCECGNIFTTCVGNFTSQNKLRCGFCSGVQSNLEHLVEIELCRLGVTFEKQKRFDKCRNPKTNYMLPFDFYIKDWNVCIEVDGDQHYRPSKFCDITDEEAARNFKYIIFKDSVKTEFCRHAGIKLIRISYKSFWRYDNNYKDILKELFKQP